MAAAEPARTERRAVCSLQMLLDLWAFCFSDSGSIHYLVNQSHVPRPVGGRTAQRRRKKKKKKKKMKAEARKM